MKKLILTLLVFGLAMPAMAATLVITDNLDGTATVTVTAEGSVNIVGLALDVDVTAGGDLTAAVVNTATFNIYMDAAYSEVNGDGYTYGEGSAIASQTVAGEVAISNNICISAAALNGESTAGATGSASVSITISASANTTIQIKENDPRGGIILVDGTGEDITSGTAGVVEGTITAGGTECMMDTHPDYAAWEAAGKPDCWCYEFNCKGDADGKAQFGYQVLSDDLAILAAAYGQALASGAAGHCADFDRQAQFGYRVLSDDLAILAGAYGQAVASCDATYINEWIVP